MFHPGRYLGQGLGLSGRDVDCLLYDLLHDSRLGPVATIGCDCGTANTTTIRDGDINVIDIIISFQAELSAIAVAVILDMREN